MSDVEASGARGTTAAPITSIAVGKLRAIETQRTALPTTDGFIDAFAEVFASIASSQPVVTRTPPQEPERTGPVNTQTNGEGNDDLASDPRNSPIAPRSNAENEDATFEFGQERVDTASNDSSGQLSDNQNGNEQPEVSEAAPVVVQTEVERINEAIVVDSETPAAVGTGEENRSSQTTDIDASQHEETGNDRRRDHRDEASVKPQETRENGDWQSKRTAVNSEPSTAAGDTDDSQQQQPNEHLLGHQEAESSDRRRYGRGEPDPASNNQQRQAISHSDQNPTGQRRQATSPSPDGGLSDFAAPQAETDNAQRQTANRHVDSAVASLQNVASNSARSNRPNVSQPRTESTQRTEAVGENHPASDPARQASKTTRVKNQTADTVSRIKLIQRVSKAFQHLGPEGGVVRLRLAPAEMGSVRVEMRIHQRKVQARVVAESESASAVLREHLPELRQRLESQGMEVEKLEIEIEHQDTFLGSQGGQEGGRQAWERPERSTFQQPLTDLETSQPNLYPAPVPVSYTSTRPSTGGVDVRL